MPNVVNEAAGPLLDFDRLRAQTADDAALARELLRLFLAATPPLIEAMTTASDNGCDIRDLAHRLRSAALAIGAVRLAAVAAAVERSPEGTEHDLHLHAAVLPALWTATQAVILETMRSGEDGKGWPRSGPRANQGAAHVPPQGFSSR